MTRTFYSAVEDKKARLLLRARSAVGYCPGSLGSFDFGMSTVRENTSTEAEMTEELESHEEVNKRLTSIQ